MDRMITYEQARILVDQYARTAAARWFDRDVIEKDTYWYFPVGYGGSCGVVVAEETGTITTLGSAFGVDDWLWGYENKFLCESVTLRVLTITDFEQCLQVLQSSVTGAFRWRYELRNWLKQRLASLPAEFPSQDLALRIPDYRAALEKGWFTFELLDD